MRTIVLWALLSVAGHGEVIRYYLHDATIGNDPHHAVNATVTGLIDYDVTAGRILDGGFAFVDQGQGTDYSTRNFPWEMLLYADHMSATNVMSFTGSNFERYDYSGQLTFTTPITGGPQFLLLDLSASFVHIVECTVPGPGGCNGVAHPIDLHFTAGELNDAPPAASPEPSTLILSATCGCLLAWMMKRSRRRSYSPGHTHQDQASRNSTGIPTRNR